MKIVLFIYFPLRKSLFIEFILFLILINGEKCVKFHHDSLFFEFFLYPPLFCKKLVKNEVPPKSSGFERAAVKKRCCLSFCPGFSRRIKKEWV
jgi:hypothetical protein